MEIRELDWYQDFSCIGGDCPQTCCRGWIIPLSPEDITRLQSAQGALGLRIFAAAGGWTRDNFNQKSRQCPFWNKEGLCELQLKKGHQFIPEACQSYPRFFRNYGIFEQRTLDLSCVQAARMFTQHAGNISFHATEGEPATIPCSTNDDPEFLDDLIRVRDEMIQELQEQNPALTAKDFILSLDELLRRMFAFACNAQSASLGQNDTFTFRFLRESHIIPQSRPDTSPINATEGPSLFPLPLHTLRGLLDSSLYHPNLSYSNPTLHELMQDAFRYIDSAKQESLWQSHTADFFSRHPETMRLYTGYLTYYLHQYFLRIYETYSYRRQVALGIIHMNLLLLLDVTYEKRHGSLSSEEFSQILAVYNRRAYFSDKIQDTLYRIFEDAIV